MFHERSNHNPSQVYPTIRTAYTRIPQLKTTHSRPAPDRRKQCATTEKVRSSARKRLPPESDSDSEYNVDDENSVSDGSEFTLGTTSSSTEQSDKSNREGDFVRQHSTLPVPDRTEFESWEAFDTYIRSYQSETCQVFRLRTNKKVGERNTIIERTGSKSPPIPETWVWYAKTLVCTHAGKFKSRGKGKRARQESRSIECPAQINVCVREVDKTARRFGVCITKMKTSHNHLVDSTTYQHYPVIRTAVGDSVLQTVGALQKAGAGKKNILQFITENSDCTPTIRDVHNLVRKLKARTTQSTTSAQRLKAWVIDFCGEHGNVGRIFVEAR
ncbi:hypothetical protein F442_22278 [Phytophthora nicotianae P10297]|uniref:FAR1 domain-containing protein n=1 Tax=Phytophthora nicotianae P10297 TaxID=1317064 RepID=W2Y1C9_PHYNI|nr:hypothetical protein F442_22278 [Phytophthora nicotianae P10297]